MEEIARSMSMKSVEDMLVSIGYGKISTQQIIHRLVPEEAEEEPLKIKPQKQQEPKGIRIKGVDGILYHTAKCCYPVPGDSVVGFVTRGKGVTIHRKDCSNLQRLALDESRLIEVEWNPDESTIAPARLYVETVDRPGVLANLSALISSMNVNISSLQATTTPDRRAYLAIIVQVRDKNQLLTLSQKLASADGVISVRR